MQQPCKSELLADHAFALAQKSPGAAAVIAFRAVHPTVIGHICA